jgi:hypothetical protein
MQTRPDFELFLHLRRQNSELLVETDCVTRRAAYGFYPERLFSAALSTALIVSDNN